MINFETFATPFFPFITICQILLPTFLARRPDEEQASAVTQVRNRWPEGGEPEPGRAGSLPVLAPEPERSRGLSQRPGPATVVKDKALVTIS